jgi:hypothetical protein
MTEQSTNRFVLVAVLVKTLGIVDGDDLLNNVARIDLREVGHFRRR